MPTTDPATDADGAMTRSWPAATICVVAGAVILAALMDVGRGWLLAGLLAAAAVTWLVVARSIRTVRDREQHRFATLVSQVSEAVVVVDDQGRITDATPAATRLLGSDPVGAPAAVLVEQLHPDERAATLAALLERLQVADARPIHLPARLTDHAGRARYVELTAVDHRDDPVIAGVVLTVRETTDRSLLEVQLRQLAFHDPLTGLPNRELLHDRLSQALSRTARSGRPLAVLLCDLDDFKDINDTLGHPAGDELLRQLARRFAGAVRATDTVARIGGDEFLVLCEDLGGAQDALVMARRLLAATREPAETGGRRVYPGISIGIAIDHGERSADELIRDADIALYEAKAEGKSRWALHRTAMTTRVQHRSELAAQLGDAVAAGHIDVSFQPVVRLADEHTVGLEALARWTDPQGQPHSPAEFIPLAERAGLVVDLGDRVLDRALGTLSELDAEGIAPPRLGVNVSPRQIREPRLVDRVRELLVTHHVAPSRLVLELTESVLLDDPKQVLANVRALRELGVRFAVDDFGTGYSSLAYLRQLPVDTIKIDRSFIASMLDDSDQQQLVGAIVNLGRSIHLEVIAEGVELAAQRDRLRAIGCELGQGYLWSQPLPAAQLRRWLGRDDRAAALDGPTTSAGRPSVQG
ncbi:MAG: putative bifunctional diguanylate cyclase/phosphodiesterase [Actinomycetota bacterium]